MTDLKNYAEALFLIAEEDSKLEAVKEELCTVNTVMEENLEYAKILDTPALAKDERLGLVDKAFSAISENVRNLIKILTEKREVHAIGRLYLDFLALYNKRMGIIPVEVVSAVELSEIQMKKLKEKLENMLSKKVEISNKIDKKLLGGLILRYDSVQLDGSLCTRLDKIAQGLKSAVL